jgi:WD40 repeat protein
VTSGLDPALSWWNAQTGERIKRTPGHDVAVHELAFGPGDLLASAGADKSIRLWNAKSMDSTRTISVGSMAYAVAISPDGKTVAAGTFDGQVRLFAVADGRPLATLVGLSDDEWIAVTPEGFALASDGLTTKGRWRAGKASVNSDWVWKAVRQPVTVAKALAGEKLGEPAFAGPQP